MAHLGRTPVMQHAFAYVTVFAVSYILIQTCNLPSIAKILISDQIFQPSESDVIMTDADFNHFMQDLQNSGKEVKVEKRPSYNLPKFCSPKRLIYEENRQSLTALVSTSGSDEVWIRKLIEELTGFYTGSVEVKNPVSIFYGEGIKNASVFTISTRTFCSDSTPYEKVLVILRNPAVAAFENMVQKQKDMAKYDGNKGKKWTNHLKKYVDNWQHLYECTFAKMNSGCLIEYENALETLKDCLANHFGIFIDANLSKCIFEFSQSKKEDLNLSSVFQRYFKLLQPLEQTWVESVHAEMLNKFRSKT